MSTTTDRRPRTAPDRDGRPGPLLVRLVVMFVVVEAVLVAGHAVGVAVGDDPLVQLVTGLVTAAGALAVYTGVVRLLEHRRAGEIALRSAPGGLVRGAVIGAVLMSATVGVLAVLGAYRVTGWGSFGPVVAAGGVMASAAVCEELLLRGVVFRLVEERLGTWGAMALSSVVFGALHLVNPAATAWGAVALAVEAGALLAAAYAATRTLWLPIGLHFAWNLCEGAVFGATVSGSTSSAPASLLRSVVDGPAVLTGGGFGPEAGVPALVVCLVATVLLVRLAVRRGHVRPARGSTSGQRDGRGSSRSTAYRTPSW